MTWCERQTVDKLKYYCLNIKHAYYDKNAKAISHHDDASDAGAASFWLDSQDSKAVIFLARSQSKNSVSKTKRFTKKLMNNL